MSKEKRVRRLVRNNPLSTNGFKKSASAGTLTLGQELKQVGIGEPLLHADLAHAELLAKLQSGKSDDRASAAVILANLASTNSTRSTVTKVDLIRVAAPLLLDPSSHTRHCISRYLGAISDAGKGECEKLLIANVMPTIASILKKFQEYDWTGADKGQSTILEDVLYLLEGLCENSELAVDTFNREGYIEAIFPLLQTKLTDSFRISTAAGLCLLAVTEGNAKLKERLKSEYSTLESIINDDHTSASQVVMKALATSLLYNLDAPESYLPLQLTAIKSILETSVQPLIDSISDETVKIAEVEETRELEDFENSRKQHETAVHELSELLLAKRIALELITNLCCTEDDDDEWDDVEDSDGDSSRASHSEKMDIESGFIDTQSPDYIRLLNISQLLPLVESHTADLSQKQIAAYALTEETKSLVNDVEDIRFRAFLCIDNIVQRSRIEDLGAQKVLGLLVDFMTALVKSLDNDDIFDALASVNRALADCILRGSKADRPYVMSVLKSADLITICENARKSPTVSVRINVSRLLTCLALQVPSLASGTVQFLFEIATEDKDLRVCSEAFDCIIDLFSNEENDAVMHEFELLGKLQAAAPKFRQMYKTYPKSQTKMLACTCGLNLKRFIKYKRGQIS